VSLPTLWSLPLRFRLKVLPKMGSDLPSKFPSSIIILPSLILVVFRSYIKNIVASRSIDHHQFRAGSIDHALFGSCLYEWGNLGQGITVIVHVSHQSIHFL